MWISLVLCAVMADALLAYFVGWAMDQVTYGDRGSVYELLFKRGGWIRKVAGGTLLLLAPVTIAIVVLGIIVCLIAVFVVVKLPGNDQNNEQS